MYGHRDNVQHCSKECRPFQAVRKRAESERWKYTNPTLGLSSVLRQKQAARAWSVVPSNHAQPSASPGLFGLEDASIDSTSRFGCLRVDCGVSPNRSRVCLKQCLNAVVKSLRASTLTTCMRTPWRQRQEAGLLPGHKPKRDKPRRSAEDALPQSALSSTLGPALRSHCAETQEHPREHTRL